MSPNERRPPAKVEVLGAEECWRLLAGVEYGRLATSTDGEPDIFPVDLVAADDALYFRTGSGGKLKALNGNPNAALECDGGAPRPSWSVVVRGTVRRMTLPPKERELDALAGQPWPFDAPAAWFELRAATVTGRRFLWHPDR